MSGYSFVGGGALYNWFNTNLPFSEALVKANEDGTANLYTLAADIGQGTETLLSQVVAEELGIALEDVKITTSDTDTCPVDLGSFSSRVSMQAGNAAKAAAAQVKQQLFEVAAPKLELRLHEELEAKDRRIYVKGRPESGISFSEAVLAAQRAKSEAVIGRGAFLPRGRVWMGSPAWTFGAQSAEVEVDRETGQVKVLKIATAHDCGRAINPMSVEGQVEGSIHMSLGYALSEDHMIDEGEVRNPDFRDYKLFPAEDMPQVESVMVETDDPEGPFGAKEAGEGLSLPTTPAIANAIYDAVGVRIKDLPITPEKILRALREKD